MSVEKIDWSFTSPEEIIDLYYKKQWGIKRIATFLGVADTSLWKYMRDHGLPTRERLQVYKNEWGPVCPKCNSRESKIAAVRPVKTRPYLRRSRKCSKCGAWFVTREYTIADLPQGERNHPLLKKRAKLVGVGGN